MQLSDIKRLRKKYGLSQQELSTLAKVSQSLIAKIEAGSVEPTFSKAQQIFEALEQAANREEPKAEDIMRTKIVFVKARDKVSEVITLMKKRGISQIPVEGSGGICGLVSESSLLNYALEHPHALLGARVEDVMGDAPPIILRTTRLPTIIALLREHSIVLVGERGKVVGLIAKSDVLGRVE